MPNTREVKILKEMAEQVKTIEEKTEKIHQRNFHLIKIQEETIEKLEKELEKKR